MRPIPVDRYLVPPTPAAPPADATLVELPLSTGLPAVVPLDATASLVLALATGLATEWRAADPVAPVASSAREADPFLTGALPIGDVTAARLTLALRLNGVRVAVVPVVGGRHLLVAPGDPAARRYAVWILEWELRAGTVRGPGDFGSRLRLAWRSADHAPDWFSPVPPNPVIIRRIPPPPPESTGTAVARMSPAVRLLLKKGRLPR